MNDSFFKGCAIKIVLVWKLMESIGQTIEKLGKRAHVLALNIHTYTAIEPGRYIWTTQRHQLKGIWGGTILNI